MKNLSAGPLISSTARRPASTVGAGSAGRVLPLGRACQVIPKLAALPGAPSFERPALLILAHQAIQLAYLGDGETSINMRSTHGIHIREPHSNCLIPLVLLCHVTRVLPLR